MMDLVDLGLISYNDAWAIQEELRLKREKGEIPDRLLLLEHSPVFTMGRRDCDDDIVSARELILKDGIDIVKTNRGGRITYHGPGQLVGYFICSIEDLGVKRFVWLIEELILRVIAGFGVEGCRDSEHPGIWVGRDKIAAIGLHVSRGITQHGFALNVDPDLDHYRHIIPCGIRARGVTSLRALLQKTHSMDEIKTSLMEHTRCLFRQTLK